MAGIYYVELADWCSEEGLSVVQYSGWQTRARSSGGFPSTPLGVQWHHTAGSGSNPQADCDWMWRNSSDRPIGNIYLARDGKVWIGAAGAANTAGKGGPYPLSRGTVPQDQGNTRTFAIEAANSGVGQAWPQAQIDAYFKLSNMLNRRFGNKPTDLFTHADYTFRQGSYRKIDPATAAAVQGPWKPRSVNSSGSWNVSDVQSEASKRSGTTPPKPPSGGKYTVKSGDSWWSISEAYGITVDQLVAMNPPATSTTVIHPGQVLNVPGGTPPTPPPAAKAPNGLTAAENQAAGSKAATPPANPVIDKNLVHNNSPWLQQVLCSMPTLAADGGKPIFPPEWVGEGRVGNETAVFRKFGDAGHDALAYWQSKNGLTADGVFGSQTQQRMRQVRGK